MVDEAEEELEMAPVLLVTHVNQILHSVFSKVEVYINDQQIYKSNEVYGKSLTFSTNSREPSSKTREFFTASGATKEKFVMGL